MWWIRIDAPHWTRMGCPVFSVELNERHIITQCADVVRKFRGQSWYALERWLSQVAGPYTWRVL